MGFFDFLFKENEQKRDLELAKNAAAERKKLEEDEAEKKRIDGLKAKSRQVLADLREMLIKEYLDYMGQYRAYEISEAYMKQLVMGVMLRERELKEEALNNDMVYEEIAFEQVLERLDIKEEAEHEWKSYTPEKEAKRAELWEKRRVLYEELKDITDNYTMHIVELEETEALLKEWRKEVKGLIEEYEMADLPYKPIFDYWAKNKHKVEDDDEFDEDDDFIDDED